MTMPLILREMRESMSYLHRAAATPAQDTIAPQLQSSTKCAHHAGLWCWCFYEVTRKLAKLKVKTVPLALMQITIHSALMQVTMQTGKVFLGEAQHQDVCNFTCSRFIASTNWCLHIHIWLSWFQGDMNRLPTCWEILPHSLATFAFTPPCSKDKNCITYVIAGSRVVFTGTLCHPPHCDKQEHSKSFM